MNGYESPRKRTNRARERQMARHSRRPSLMASLPNTGDWRSKVSGITQPVQEMRLGERLSWALRDGLWYVRHTPALWFGLIGLVGVLFVVFVATHVFNGRVFPNVWAAGVNLGDKTVEEAAAALDEAWATHIQIRLMDGDRAWDVTPAQLGLVIDSKKTAEAARAVGMSGLPMGYGIPPVVSVDFNTAQTFLLDLTNQTDIAPENAGYTWQNDELVGIPGADGRMLDVPHMMERLSADPAQIVEFGHVDLVMTTLPPEMSDPTPYLEQVRAATSQPITLIGYDPFTDQTVSWSTTRDVFTSWIEVGEQGLQVREAAFEPFLQAQVQSLNAPEQPQRYLDMRETKEAIAKAVEIAQSQATLRIRYRPQEYTVERGDTAYRIARKTGLPYYLVEKANEGRDLNVLSPGDTINLPSKDATIPLNPIPNKRIVVDLNNQTLKAFEKGQIVFDWLISSGIETAPTSPGIFQVLTHNEVANGSSYTLCSESGCGSWEMYWFMGMYEVTPGLMNGFHGAVLLPNGAYLGGGNVGAPFTFGCVMSQNDNAKLLYDWADEGTIVEIISSEFAPQSPIGQQVWTNATSGA